MPTSSGWRAASPQHPAILLRSVQPPGRAALARQHVRVVLQELHPVTCDAKMPSCHNHVNALADESRMLLQAACHLQTLLFSAMYSNRSTILCVPRHDGVVHSEGVGQRAAHPLTRRRRHGPQGRHTELPPCLRPARRLPAQHGFRVEVIILACGCHSTVRCLVRQFVASTRPTSAAALLRCFLTFLIAGRASDTVCTQMKMPLQIQGHIHVDSRPNLSPGNASNSGAHDYR